ALDRDVAAAVQAPKARRRLPRMPKEREAVALLDGVAAAAAGDDPRALRDHALLELLYGAGLRVSECCGLDVAGADCRKSTVTVLGKGAKVRRLPLGEPARAAVERYLRDGRAALLSGAEATNALLINGRGHRLTPRDARRVLDRHPLPDGRRLHPHALR